MVPPPPLPMISPKSSMAGTRVCASDVPPAFSMISFSAPSAVPSFAMVAPYSMGSSTVTMRFAHPKRPCRR